MQKLDVLLSTVKERFSANLEESKHSIIFLSVIQENGMEVVCNEAIKFLCIL